MLVLLKLLDSVRNLGCVLGFLCLTRIYTFVVQLIDFVDTFLAKSFYCVSVVRVPCNNNSRINLLRLYFGLVRVEDTEIISKILLLH